MRRWACCVMVLAGLAAARSVHAQSADPDEHYIIRVTVTDTDKQIPALAAMQLDLAGIDVKAGTADFVGDWRTFQDLRDAGFAPEVVWSSTMTSVEALSDYLDPVEVSQRLDIYQAAYPALAKKVQIGSTVNGRALWAMKISDNVSLEEDEPVVFYVGQHHAREVMTTEVTTDIIDYLLSRYATDATVRSWVDSREIWVVVSENPDGADYVFNNSSSWRKNRRNNGDGFFGVDPNRNYAFHWNLCNGSSGATSSDTYRGPSAGSEPETQAYTQLARDQRPVTALSYHTYSELVIHPYGCAGTLTSENRMFRDFTSDVAARVRNDANDGYYSNGTPWELLYAVDGDSDGWFYGVLGTAAITIEANSSAQGFQPDYNTWRNSTVLRNRPGWQYLLDRVDGPSIWGHTTDACSGTALSSTIGIDEIVFSGGETPRTSEPGYGRYQWLTPLGTWHLNASKTGYRAQDWPIDVGFKAIRREVRLVPSGSYAVDFLSKTIQDTAGDHDAEVDPGETVTMPVTVYATGGAVSALTAVLTSADPYVTITDANGAWPSIAAGGTAASSNSFAFSVSPQCPDGHVIAFTLTFSAAQSLCASVSTFDVRVTTGAPSCPAIDQPLDVNPGWTIQNTDALGWAFGAPGGTGGNNGPSAAHSGSFVYGTNLTGNYGNNADYKLITTPFDLSALRNTELRFWRWLNDQAGYDVASVDISTNGVNFTNVWTGFGRDTQWEPYRLDISSLADGQPAVYVRFRLQSNSSTVASGLYLDDISICGETLAPAPALAVTSWTLNDAENPACSDHDAYADGGETAALTVNIKNQGSSTSLGATAVLSSTDSHLAMIDFRAPLGDLAPGATAAATYRFKVAVPLSCREQAPFRVDFDSNAGAYRSSDSRIVLTLQADDGAPVPDSSENFESGAGWTLTGEWQIGVPMARGGSPAAGGSGNPDPATAYSGTKVLGVDLSGSGASPGNYENNLSGGITATSPVYNCANATNVQLEFKRWLGVEQSQYDKATVEVWNGSSWQIAWTNPNSNFSDSSWQDVSYDVSAWAAGNPTFQVRFKMTSDGGVVYCGWNIDDLHLTNGYTPQGCETGSCAAGCTPSAELTGLTVSRTAGITRLVWTASASACHETGGAGYRVYRSASPGRRMPAPTQWPMDSYFTDVTTRDVDASAANTSFTEPGTPLDTPPPGSSFFYLVVDMGTNGLEGPKGWQGL